MSERVKAVNRLLYKGGRLKCSNLAGVMVKRAPTKITVQAINLNKAKGDVLTAPTKSEKEKGAWQYPGHVIQRAEHLKGLTNANNEPYTDDKDPGEARRKHESNFFITLNTNRYIGDGVPPRLAQEAKQAVVTALERLSDDASICTYLKFGPKSKHYQHDKYVDVISKVEWEAAVETGENLQRLHCHIWLTVHHASQIQINMPVMQKMFKDFYNTRAPQSLRIVRGKPYIQVKLLPSSDWATVMKQYIHKGMRAVASS